MALTGQAVAGAVALGCAGAAGWLAWHHPLSPAAVLAACGLLAALACWRPATWPLWLLGLLPWIGLMPWTGWFVVEEIDLAVLALAAGGYARLAWAAWPPQRAERCRHIAVVLLWLLPLALSTAVGAQRGLADAGGLTWGWWQGYREPLNSLRQAKPLAVMLLLLPLAHAGLRQDARAPQFLRQGLLLMLAGAAVAVLWERWVYTGLANFATDYRATGLFWEMHVGGAALDAVLCMSIPFALAALAAPATARSPLRWLVLAGALALGLYAALATFSRIVYGAVPLSLAIWWGLQRRQTGGARPALPARAEAAVPAAVPGDVSGDVSGDASGDGPGQVPGEARGEARGVNPAELAQKAVARRAGVPNWAFAACGLLVYGAVGFGVFVVGGYRGLLAWLGIAALWAPLLRALRALTSGGWWRGLGFGVALLAAVAAASLWLPKGAYLAYAAAWCGTAACLALPPRPVGAARAVLALGGLIGMTGGLVAVCVFWGGAQAWPAGLLAVAVVAALLAIGAGPRTHVMPSWPAGWHAQAWAFSGLLAVSAVVAVAGAGSYMKTRISATSTDGLGRESHWARALDLLGPPDWAIGRGLGRYPATQALSGRPEDQTGDLRLMQGSGNQWLVLTGGNHALSTGVLFRLSQRISRMGSDVTLQLRVRSPADSWLRVEICEKHLLYGDVCVGDGANIQGQPGLWQSVRIALGPVGKARQMGGPWYAPATLVFAISVGKPASRVEIDDLQLLDQQGHDVLANGGFEGGLARWFFTSDRHHLPWHVKNMALHLVFEQGLFGLGAFALALAAAVWRVSFGAGRQHPLAPALAAALFGAFAVGLVDSVLDIPRATLLLLLLMATALSVPAQGRALK